jgi:hypothetical protein
MPHEVRNTEKGPEQQPVTGKNDPAQQNRFQKMLYNLNDQQTHNTNAGSQDNPAKPQESRGIKILKGGIRGLATVNEVAKQLNQQLEAVQGQMLGELAKTFKSNDDTEKLSNKKPSSSPDQPSAEKSDEAPNRNSLDDDSDRNSQDTPTETQESEMVKSFAQAGEVMEMSQVEDRYSEKGVKKEVVLMADDYKVYSDDLPDKGHAHNSIEGAQDHNSLENELDYRTTALDKTPSHNSLDNPLAKGPENAPDHRPQRDDALITRYKDIIRKKGADQLLQLSIERSSKAARDMTSNAESSVERRGSRQSPLRSKL